MFDDVSAGNVPAGGDLYLGYDDGAWPDAAAIAARFPGVTVLRATVNPNDNEGDLGDCETGDMTPQTLVTWIVRRRTAGHPNPLGYCNASTWPSCKQAFAVAGVPEPPWMIAQYDNDPTIPAEWIAMGCVAKQFAGGITALYDTSVVVPHIPGIDAEPINDDQTLFFLIGGTMALALNDQDARNAAVRLLYATFIGRDPTGSEQAGWANQMAAKGLDLVIAGIYDSPEARKHRGVA